MCVFASICMYGCVSMALLLFPSIGIGTARADSVIQRNDTSKSSAQPDVVYPVRAAAAENHGNGATNAAVDRKTVTGSATNAAAAAAAAGGTVAIGQSLFYTDFPPKEYGNSGTSA